MTDQDLGNQFIGRRYAIERALGQGSMGTVYLARDTRFQDRQVVLKFPRRDFLRDPTFGRRFVSEMQRLVDVEHPNVVAIHDSGEHRGRPYMVMQFLAGGSLQDRLERGGGRQSVTDVTQWLEPIAAALDAIHERRVLHRDVKPANILFDGRGHAYLADFGISKVIGGNEITTSTGASQRMGSPAYMAPELATDRLVGPRSDQYSLAVVVYQALAGRLPHGARNVPALLRAKVSQEPPPIVELCPDLHENACRAVTKALAREPELRFATCRQMADTFMRAPHDGVGELDRTRRSSTRPAVTQHTRPSGGARAATPGSRRHAAHWNARPQRRHHSASRQRRQRMQLAAAIGAVLIAGALYVVLRPSGSALSRNGTVAVRTSPAGIRFRFVRGAEESLEYRCTDAATPATCSVSPGSHRLELREGNDVLESRAVTVEPGGSMLVTFRRPAHLPAALTEAWTAFTNLEFRQALELLQADTADPRLRPHWHALRGFVHWTRTQIGEDDEGLAKARTDILKCLDADDLYLPPLDFDASFVAFFETVRSDLEASSRGESPSFEPSSNGRAAAARQFLPTELN